MGGIPRIERRCGSRTGGIEFLNPAGRLPKGSKLKGRDARDWERESWDSDHSAHENLFTHTPPIACSQPWGKGEEL